MAGTATKSAEELAQAYKQAISSNFAAVDAGMAQTTAAVKMFTDSLQDERDEAGKVWEQTAGYARSRSEKMTGFFRELAAMPASGAPSFSPEAKESIDQLIENDLAFYRAWTEYLAGVEQRRGAMAQDLLESNTRMIESGQEAMKSAMKYGEALMDWSLGTARGIRS